MIGLILLPIKILLILMDLTITLVTFRWVKPLQSYFTGTPLRTCAVDGEQHIRRDVRYKDKLATTPREGVLTLYDVLKDAAERYGNRPSMATREFIGWKTPKIKEFGPTITWLTFRQVYQQALQFGAACRAVGCVAAPETTNLDKITLPCRVAIFENTCAPWMIAAMGAFTQSMTVTTVYATLGIDAVVEAVSDNIIRVIVCNKASVAKLVKNCPNMPTLKYIVYTNDLVPVDAKIEWPEPPKGVQVISFEEFVQSGDVKKYPPVPPKPSTCAVVMYTSGSTGKPKGVIINHSQVVAGCASADIGFGIREGEEVYLAYLPLAHIMELMAECVMISKGCALCFADPKSLTTTGAYPIGALEVFSPTLMVAVPKIWDVIKKGIQTKVAAESPIKQELVATALKWRKFCLKHGFDAPLFDKVVFKKFKKAVGGRLRLAVSGGGPLNGEVQDFIRTAFGISLVQGYGLTETCAGGTFQAVDDMSTGVAGVAIPAVEIKLESTPDVGDKAGVPYLSTDKFDVDGNPVYGRGEILIRGNTVSCGYYMEPEKTKEVFEEDGWFHTGDIGQFLSDGSLRIVDRKKNLVKLKGGEYVALEKMEMTFGNSSFVDAVAGGICCYGDGDMDRPVALLQLSEAYTMKWAKENGISGDFQKILETKELHDAVLADMHKEHSKSDLSHLEKVVAVALLTEPWTPENGCLTAANKLQRRQVIETHSKEFDQVKAKGVFD